VHLALGVIALIASGIARGGRGQDEGSGSCDCDSVSRQHRGLHSEFRWVIDRRALEYSPYVIERTTAAARQQLSNFVEDGAVSRARLLSKSS
jgi:hypothetical protein